MLRCFVVTSFGPRFVWANQMVGSIRDFFSDPIFVYTNNAYWKFDFPDVTTVAVPEIWQGKRAHHRHGDYYPLKAVEDLEQDFEFFCCLDDDMMIFHPGFEDGFRIAESFGIALPQNPRVYVWEDSNGEDVTSELRNVIFKPFEDGIPMYATGVNFSPMFICQGICSDFVDHYLRAFMDSPCRGPLALWRSLWECKLTPFILPETFCICGENAQFWFDKVVMGHRLDIMCLHLGHKKVREVFHV